MYKQVVYYNVKIKFIQYLIICHLILFELVINNENIAKNHIVRCKKHESCPVFSQFRQLQTGRADIVHCIT